MYIIFSEKAKPFKVFVAFKYCNKKGGFNLFFNICGKMPERFSDTFTLHKCNSTRIWLSGHGGNCPYF